MDRAQGPEICYWQPGSPDIIEIILLSNAAVCRDAIAG
jgi:hypothetical protein